MFNVIRLSPAHVSWHCYHQGRESFREDLSLEGGSLSSTDGCISESCLVLIQSALDHCEERSWNKTLRSQLGYPCFIVVDGAESVSAQQHVVRGFRSWRSVLKTWLTNQTMSSELVEWSGIDRLWCIQGTVNRIASDLGLTNLRNWPKRLNGMSDDVMMEAPFLVRKINLQDCRELQHWVNRLAGSSFRVSGVYSASCLAELASVSFCTCPESLVVSSVPGGSIRHAFYRYGQLTFSRLLSLSNVGNVSVEHEIDKTFLHLRKNQNASESIDLIVDEKTRQLVSQEYLIKNKITNDEKLWDWEFLYDQLGVKLNSVFQRFIFENKCIYKGYLNRADKPFVDRPSGLLFSGLLLTLVTAFCLIQGVRNVSLMQAHQSAKAHHSLIKRDMATLSLKRNSLVPRADDVLRKSLPELAGPRSAESSFPIEWIERILSLNSSSLDRVKTIPITTLLSLARALSEYPELTLDSVGWEKKDKSEIFGHIPNSSFERDQEGADLQKSFRVGDVVFLIDGRVRIADSHSNSVARGYEQFRNFTVLLQSLIVPAAMKILDAPFGLTGGKRVEIGNSDNSHGRDVSDDGREGRFSVEVTVPSGAGNEVSSSRDTEGRTVHGSN